MRRWVARTTAIAAVLVAALVAAYACRGSIAGLLLEHYLARFGVTSKVEVTRLNLDDVGAHVRLGMPSAPDVTATVDASIVWAGLKPRIHSVHVTAARVVTRFDGRRLSLGAEDRLLDTLRNRPSGQAPPDITVEGAGLVIEAPQGRIELALDAALRSGALQSLRARLLPVELRDPNLTIGVQGGTLRIESNADGLDFQAQATGRVLMDVRGTPARLEHLQVSADGIHVKLNEGRGVDFTGGLKVQAEARSVELGMVAADRVTAVVDAPTARFTGPQSRLDARLLGDLHTDGLKFGRGGATAVVQSAEVRIRAAVTSDSLAPKVAARADLHLTGGVSDGIARQISLGARSLGADSSIASALVRAMRSLAVSVDNLHANYSSGRIETALERPAVLSGGNGLRVSLEPHAHTELLEGDLAARRFQGAFKLRVAGGGMPTVRVAVHSYSSAVGADGLPVTNARLHVGARLSMGHLRGLAVAANSMLRAEGGRYRLFIQDCADVSLDRLTLDRYDLVGVKTQLCGVQAPWLVGDERGWAMHSLWRSFSARLPSMDTELAGGAGRLDLSGRMRGMIGGELKITALQIADRLPAPRFAPAVARGTVALEDRMLEGALELVVARSGQPLGKILARHCLTTGRGEARVDMSGLEFARDGLQPSMLSPLLQPLAHAYGRSGFDGAFSWTPGKLSSRGVLRLENFGFSSAVGDVTQVNAEIELTSLVPPQSAPHQRVSVGEIGAVLPLTKLSGHFELLPAAVNIEDTRMDFAGGTITIDPTTVSFDRNAKMSATVRLQEIDLNKLVAASSFADRLKLDVHVSGAIPLSNSSAGWQVTHGSFSSTGPGRIEINRSIWSADAANPGNAFRDFAYQALEHLGVDQLDGTVDSLPDGRLGLVLHVRGRHDPPVAVPTRVGIVDFLRGHAFDRPLPLPKGTPIDLTLDSSLNFEGLLDTYRAATSAAHH